MSYTSNKAIAARRTIAYTTVMTVCVRLAEKGLLRRDKAGQGYVYTATVGEREFGPAHMTVALPQVA
jgi:predicted transcriptional regulator